MGKMKAQLDPGEITEIIENKRALCEKLREAISIEERSSYLSEEMTRLFTPFVCNNRVGTFDYRLLNLMKNEHNKRLEVLKSLLNYYNIGV